MKRKWIWLGIGMNCFAGALNAQPVVEELLPTFGVPGDVIELTGAGFEGDDLEMKLGDATAPVSVSDQTTATFTIPAGATTGDAILISGETEIPLGQPFWITRAIPVAVDPSMLPRLAEVGSAFGDSRSTEGPFSVDVADTRPTLVIAAASEDEALGLGLALPGASSAVITPESTLLALLFLHPDVNDFTGENLPDVRNRMTALPVYPALIELLESKLAAGDSWVGLPAFQNLFAVLLEEYFRTVSLESTGQGTLSFRDATPWRQAEAKAQFESLFSFEQGTPKDLPKTNFFRLERLDAAPGRDFVDRSGNPILGLKFNPTEIELFSGIPFWDGRFKGNPLDWKADLYKLDPDQPLIDTPAAVASLQGSWTRTFDRLQVTPIDSVIVPATLATANLDPWGQLKKFIISKASPGNFVGAIFKDSAPKTQLNLPADESGIYMVRAFSGARNNLQTDLVKALPLGAANDSYMFKWNMVVGIQNFVLSMLGSHPSLKDRNFLKLLIGTGASSLNSVEREYTARDEVISQSQALGIAKVLLDTMTSKALDYTKSQLLPSPKLKGISASKAGSRAVLFNLVIYGGQLAERLLAVTNAPQLAGGVLENSYMAMSVEDTLVVVGDPWTPVIENFSPRKGHRGTEVRITGKNFSSVPGENIVTFGALTTNPLDPSPTARAEVVLASENSLVVKVPEDSKTGYITVGRQGGSKAFSTFDLKEPFKNFEVIEDPVITSIHPANPRPSSKVLIRGENLAKYADVVEVTYSVGQFSNKFPVYATRPDGFIVEIPNLEGPNTITISINGRVSNVFEFTSAWPDPADANWMWVNSNADTNARDGVLTLREALMLANGELTYAELNLRPDNVSTGDYEGDQVAGQPGDGQFDIIQLEVADISLSAPLPKLSSRDFVTGGGTDSQSNLQLETTIMANGTEGPGFVLDGINGNQLTNFIMKDFAGPGVLVTGGANNNFIQVIVDNSQSSGIILQGNAQQNRIGSSSINNGSHGLLLTGDDVQLNTFISYYRGGISSNQGWGIKIENGASFNEVDFLEANGNGMGGIHVQGESTILNRVGAYNAFDNFDAGASPVAGNSGPGILVEAPDTRVGGVEVSGSTGPDGHGIVVRSVLASGTQIGKVYVGYDRETGDPAPNSGHGIFITDGANNVSVGDADLPRQEVAVIAGNTQGGIVVNGANTTDVDIDNARVGIAIKADDFWGTSSPVIGNGSHGILFTGNTHNNEVALGRYGTVTVAGHNVGDGIRIEGRSNNIGMGSVTLDGNRTGLVIADQAWGNSFGLPSDYVYPSVNNNTEAGIVLSSSFNPGISIPNNGDPIVPEGRNTVQNVSFFDNEVGIHLKAGAQANLIGGKGPKDGNRFNGSTTAGILVDGVMITRADFANRIEGNSFEGPWPIPPRPADPLTAAPESVGILVRNGASGTLLGGPTAAGGNEFEDLHHGIFIDGADRTLVRNNRFLQRTRTWPDGFSETYKIQIAGVFIRNGSGNIVGPDNAFTGCGTVSTPVGGAVVISGGSGNRVAGNLIGVDPGRTEWIGNYPDGIQIHNSSMNIIGGAQGNEPNSIVMNEQYGIRITGNGSTGNQIAGNHIGADLQPAPNPLRPNGRGGVLVESGASNNIVGGDLLLTSNGLQLPVPVPNTILYNNGSGVKVDGAGSTGNRILGNSISDHVVGLGIQLTAGGNAGLAPPALVYEGDEIRGTADVPDGSTVELFSDPGDEGAVFLGDTKVASGSFEFKPAWLPYKEITATVTDLNGNTSPFANAASVPETDTIHIARVGPLEERNIGTSGSPVPAVVLEITGGGIAAFLDSLILTESGSLNATTDIGGVSLFQDLNGDGRAGPSDLLIASESTFDADNGDVRFEDLNLAINPGEVIHLVPTVYLQDGSASEQTILSLENPSSAVFKTLFSNGEVIETAQYPINSDTLTVIDDRLQDSFDQWLLTILTPQQLANPAFTDPNGDPDGDGVATIVEFLFRTNPLDPGRFPDIFAEAIGESNFQVQFRHLTIPEDLDAEFLGSRDLSAWQDITAFPEVAGFSTSPSPIGGEIITIQLGVTGNSAPLLLQLAVSRP